ncbi:TonB-dependent receptor plug domain-containing protein [Ferrimonas balearica]|uniref:TonB-dependent receptor plug domain-containing protein n=1 Tax=Ferrimonas balearica TaxID=44012 RepID=UPI001C998A87|nr:TonB-dependent receptor [Ferrimonas balearica]MBY5921321.1 TonB-dependent receptor [Ferrimonas balearica]MBY5995994.1 TonB-dependent receptor [Ferrimonas balearica]
MTKPLQCTALAVAISAPLSATPTTVWAEEDNRVERIAVVGTRAMPRSVDDSPVPVDIIGEEEFERQGATDMDDLLTKVVPSYNVNAQPISDAATLVRPANLRGLSPDSTLVLVNGKRRHRSAVITFLGGGISDGSQATDVSVIPSIALKQVEVLRDGAAAQYGSDAIAGVINFVLKDSDQGGTVQARYGKYYEGDGDTLNLAGNLGLPLTDQGFINVSAEYKTAKPTSRSVQRDDAAALIATGNSAVANPAQVWGSPEIDRDFKLFLNAGLALSDSSDAYLFGNWAERTATGGFYFRNPNTRGGVFSADGGETLLVGDLTGGASGHCPVVPIINDVPDPDALAQLIADPDCFSFYERFPGGFTPSFGGDMLDLSLTAGVKGEWASGLLYDFSAGVGRNEVDFFINNTVNASMGPNSPTRFNPGRYVQIENGVNADFSYPMDTWVLSFGGEYRKETFEIYAGDPASWTIGPLASQGFSIGSNGFPGIQPRDQGSHSRENIALYTDIEKSIGDSLLLAAALRYENYQSFGDTTNGKLSALWDLTDEFKLRGSVNTGFRAPTVGQENVRNVTTQFSAIGLQDQATLPPTNPISVQKGGKPLEPEESFSYTLGTVATLGDLYVTLDYYHIEVQDRISQTSPLTLSEAEIQALLDQGILDASSFNSVRYFTNDFDTTTQGVDLVANYRLSSDWGDTGFALAYNWNQTEVTDFNPENISVTKVRLLEENLPQHKGSLSVNHKVAKWDGVVRLNYFGAYFEDHLDSEIFPIEGSDAWTVDAEVSYPIADQIVASVGAQNLLDQRADEHPWQGVAGARYPATAPVGLNGGFYYLKLSYDF